MGKSLYVALLWREHRRESWNRGRESSESYPSPTLEAMFRNYIINVTVFTVYLLIVLSFQIWLPLYVDTHKC